MSLNIKSTMNAFIYDQRKNVGDYGIYNNSFYLDYRKDLLINRKFFWDFLPKTSLTEDPIDKKDAYLRELFWYDISQIVPILAIGSILDADNFKKSTHLKINNIIEQTTKIDPKLEYTRLTKILNTYSFPSYLDYPKFILGIVNDKLKATSIQTSEKENIGNKLKELHPWITKISQQSSANNKNIKKLSNNLNNLIKFFTNESKNDNMEEISDLVDQTEKLLSTSLNHLGDIHENVLDIMISILDENPKMKNIYKKLCNKDKKKPEHLTFSQIQDFQNFLFEQKPVRDSIIEKHRIERSFRFNQLFAIITASKRLKIYLKNKKVLKERIDLSVYLFIALCNKILIASPLLTFNQFLFFELAAQFMAFDYTSDESFFQSYYLIFESVYWFLLTSINLQKTFIDKFKKLYSFDNISNNIDEIMAYLNTYDFKNKFVQGRTDSSAFCKKDFEQITLSAMPLDK